MFEIVLYQPEIPPNAGNVIRLAANTGARLHLVGPIGFGLDERSLRRAGLDYADLASTELHADWASCAQRLAGRRVFALTTRATRCYTEEHYVPGDVFLFGPESRGLPADLLGALPADRRLRLPMLQGNRSLNLSNAVAVVVYEAWRQVGFAGADSGGAEIAPSGEIRVFGAIMPSEAARADLEIGKKAGEKEENMAKKRGSGEAVYRVVDVVGTSPVSWEDAAKRAVSTASGTLRDLRIAEVLQMDMKVDKGKVVAFRTRVALSFKYTPE